MSKFNRDNYLKNVNSNNLIEKELLTNSFSDYRFKYKKNAFTIKSKHIQRPDLISYDLYGRTDLWWFILKSNSIDDVWNELYLGQIIQVPDIRDINNYTNEYK